MNMRKGLCVDNTQTGEWKQICAAYAKSKGAKLLFVNESSCGLEYPGGSFAHVYLDEMIEELKHRTQST